MEEEEKPRKSSNGPGKAREEFLFRMYDQMFNDINTHILVVWQSVGVLVGAFAIFALAERDILPIDIATTLILLISAWLIAHLEDASYWYNRNLVIIANIERQFLDSEDLRNIHYYFGKHRAVDSMIMHLKIQFWLALGIIIVVLFYHFWTRVNPGIGAPWTNFDPLRALPYLTAVSALLLLLALRGNRKAAYREFLKNSPGTEVKTEGVEYGVGHPTDTNN